MRFSLILVQPFSRPAHDRAILTLRHVTEWMHRTSIPYRGLCCFLSLLHLPE